MYIKLYRTKNAELFFVLSPKILKDFDESQTMKFNGNTQGFCDIRRIFKFFHYLHETSIKTNERFI